MINSNTRKLALSGWLRRENETAYLSPLKLQKFLFLYEAFTEKDEGNADFCGLRGYKRGPVFSTVWGDYTKERADFDREAQEAAQSRDGEINSDRALLCSFIVSALSEEELSELTHAFHIWYSKKEDIEAGKPQVRLDKDDLSAEDRDLLSSLSELYPQSYITSHVVFTVGTQSFVIRKSDFARLSGKQFDTLYALAAEGLQNPVTVRVEEKGRLVVD